MEISGIHEVHQRLPIATSKLFTSSVGGPVSIGTERIGSDTITISPKASFQAKLDVETKKYAATEKADCGIAPARMEQLKNAYQGDHCPVSGSDIASSILKQVCGY